MNDLDLSELYTWTEFNPEIGEGTILAVVKGIGPINLITRDRRIAEGPFAELATEHCRATGHRVRLLRWTAYEILKEFIIK